MSTNTIRASVNESNFIQNMRLLFSKSTSFISEALQNAYRAQATSIRIQIINNDLIIDDDGIGIEDFSKLVTFSDSGWDETTKQIHRPYGMGVASYFFAAETLSFESRGKQVKLCCDELLNGESFVITDSDITHGTVVSFRNLVDLGLGGNNSLHKIIEKMVLGFPIPVFINGIELDRPHKLTDQCSEFAAGKVVCFDETKSLNQAHFYLQGLPIGANAYSVKVHACPGIHLDSHRYEAVMPDRAALYDHDNQFSEIKAALRDFEVQYITKEKERYNTQEFESAKCFYKRFVDRIVALDVQHLLNDVNYIDNRFLGIVDASQEDNNVNYAGTFSRETLESSGAVVVMNTPDLEDDAIAPTLLCVMGQENWLSLYRSLCEDHWIFDIAVDATALKVEVLTTGVAKTDSYNCIDAELYENVMVRLWDGICFDKKVEIKDFVLRAKPDFGPYSSVDDSTTVVFSASCTSTPQACFSDFRSEHGDYMSEWEQESREGWQATLDRLNGSCDYAVNIGRSLYHRPALAQTQGSMAVCVSSNSAYSHTVKNLDTEVFAEIASRIGCDAAVLSEAFRNVLCSVE